LEPDLDRGLGADGAAPGLDVADPND
jgi:hypothetical protein